MPITARKLSISFFLNVIFIDSDVLPLITSSLTELESPNSNFYSVITPAVFYVRKSTDFMICDLGRLFNISSYLSHLRCKDFLLQPIVSQQENRFAIGKVFTTQGLRVFCGIIKYYEGKYF